MKWLEISVECDGEAAEAVSELFNRLNSSPANDQGGAVVEVGGFDPTGRLDQPRVTVRTYVPVSRTSDERRQKIVEGLWFLGRIYPIPEPTIRELAEEDWAYGWRKHYPVLPVGERLVIVPAWLADQLKPTPSQLPIILDPGMAFGTGLHPSTRLCLKAMERHLRPGDTVLDVGCGSGILSIAAARLGAAAVLATDVDPVAVTATLENCQRNGLTHETQPLSRSLEALPEASSTTTTMHVRQGSLPDRGLKPDGWQVIAANILPGVIVQLLDQGMAHLLAEGGRLILGGIITEASTDVEAALDRYSLQVIERSEEADWVTLVAASL